MNSKWIGDLGGETRVGQRRRRFFKGCGGGGDCAGGGGGGCVEGNVLVFGWFECSRLPSSRRKEMGGIEVAGAVPREPDGVRAREALLVQPPSEGAKVDLVEPSEPRQEVLRLR